MSMIFMYSAFVCPNRVFFFLSLSLSRDNNIITRKRREWERDRKNSPAPAFPQPTSALLDNIISIIIIGIIIIIHINNIITGVCVCPSEKV